METFSIERMFCVCMIVASWPRGENTYQRRKVNSPFLVHVWTHHRFRRSVGKALALRSSFACLPHRSGKLSTPHRVEKNWICTNFPRFIWTRFFLRFILPDIFNHHQWQPLHSARSLCIFTYILSVSFRCAVSRGFFSGCESESPISRNFNSHSRSYAWSCISVLICSLFFFVYL